MSVRTPAKAGLDALLKDVCAKNQARHTVRRPWKFFEGTFAVTSKFFLQKSAFEGLLNTLDKYIGYRP